MRGIHTEQLSPLVCVPKQQDCFTATPAGLQSRAGAVWWLDLALVPCCLHLKWRVVSVLAAGVTWVLQGVYAPWYHHMQRLRGRLRALGGRTLVLGHQMPTWWIPIIVNAWWWCFGSSTGFSVSMDEIRWFAVRVRTCPLTPVVSDSDGDARPVRRCTPRTVAGKHSCLSGWTSFFWTSGWVPHGTWAWKVVGSVTSGKMVNFCFRLNPVTICVGLPEMLRCILPHFQ